MGWWRSRCSFYSGSFSDTLLFFLSTPALLVSSAEAGAWEPVSNRRYSRLAICATIQAPRTAGGGF